MFDEPDEPPADRPLDPAAQAKEKSDEFRMHAELAAVFEAHRKFDAEISPRLDPELARQCQKTIGRLEKLKSADSPLLPAEAMTDAAELLDIPVKKGVSLNDYHIHRRPGEVMIVRWIQGDQVDSFYTRLQAHFDAALNQYKEEERQSKGWKQDPQTLAYLEALDAIKIKMEDKYLRPIIRQHKVSVLSTQTADEMDILHLTELIMGADAADIVGSNSAPPDEPTEQDRAWFFKLFSLRGMQGDEERMCFFTYMQKSDGF